MPSINWCPETTQFELATTLSDTWIKALDSVTDATHLKMEAEGNWTTMPGLVMSCGPNGLAGLRLQSDHLLMPDAPAGALIAKFGGSSASSLGTVSSFVAPAPVMGPTLPALPVLPALPASAAPATGSPADGKPFVVGALCVIAIPPLSFGPLYIAINSPIRPVKLDKELRIKFSTMTYTPSQ